MKKILIVSTVSRQFYLFEQGNIEVLKEMGYEVHAAANFSDFNERLNSLDIIRHHFDIKRSPFSFHNIKAYFQLKQLIHTEKFDVVHCHSPMGGVLARLASKASGVKTIIYTAHGFHFFKGAPPLNWIIYYPIEKFLARLTDILITINLEDYRRAKKFKAKKVVYVPGIGVNTDKFKKINVDRNEKRKDLGVSQNDIVILSIGEMIKRKNYETALRTIAKLKNDNVKYLICGTGQLENDLKEMALNLNILDKVIFLGFRNDIPEICMVADLFLFPSFQEGLPVSVMEAMAAGLPIVCSSIRGNEDLIVNGINGYLASPENEDLFVQHISELLTDSMLRESMSLNNIKKIEKYNKLSIQNEMKDIYMMNIDY